MQINITGHHLDVTPALKEYVTSKLQRLERHFDNVTQAHVVLTVEPSEAGKGLEFSGSRLIQRHRT